MRASSMMRSGDRSKPDLRELPRPRRPRRRSVASTRAKPNSIDQYIAACAPEARAILRKLRSTVKRAAPPETEQLISYRMPAFALHGILVYFAAFKNHIGMFPPIRGDAKLKAESARYAGPKG